MYNSFSDFKSEDHLDPKTNSLGDQDYQLNLGEEMLLDLTGDETACEKVTSFKNSFLPSLPKKNSGFEKKAIKQNRTKHQMLGNLTFREIAGKRKDKIKNDSVNLTEDSTKKEVSDSSFKPIKRYDEKMSETTYINPHTLVGKTITLEQGGIRHIKFLSQDSNTSPNSKKLLKLDALKLTPQIIIRKNKPGYSPSIHPQRSHRDLKKIVECQKKKNKNEFKDMYSVKNSVELNFQLKFKSLPRIHAREHMSPSNKPGGKKHMRKHSGLPMQKSYETDSAEDFVDLVTESEDNETETPVINTSHDNLTILSQVACGELEMKNEFGSKKEGKGPHIFKAKVQDIQQNHKNSNYDYVSLDHSYEKKQEPAKRFLCIERSNKTRPMINKTNSQLSSKVPIKSNKTSEGKPMFAWCTQYVTNYRFCNNGTTEKHDIVGNQELKCNLVNKNVHKSSNFIDSKIQDSFQKENCSNKCDEINVNLLNPAETSKRTLFAQENPTDSKPPKPNLHCKSERKNDTFLETVGTAVETSVLNTKKLPETNDEIEILKEVLVSKSHNFNSFLSKDYDCSSDTQRNSLETGKTSSRFYNDIPVNEDRKSKFVHISNVNQNDSTPPLKTTTLTNTSPQSASRDGNDNKQIQKVSKKSSLKAIENQSRCSLIKPEETHDHKRKPNSFSMPGNIISDSLLGKKSYHIKRCLVLVERLKESTYLVGKDTEDTTSSNRNGNESYRNSICSRKDKISQNICLEENVRQIEESMKQNCESKFRPKKLLKNNDGHQILPNSSNNKSLLFDLIKKGSEDDTSNPLHLIKECKTNPATNERASQINITKERMSTSQNINSESQIDNDLVMSKVCFQENKNDFVKSLSDSKKAINNKQLSTHGADVKTGCRRKITVTEQDLKSFTSIKKGKLHQGRPKKLITNNVKTSTKKLKKPKEEHEGLKVYTENHEESNSFAENKKQFVSKQKDAEVPTLNNNVVGSPDNKFSGNREIYSLLSDFTTLGCSIELDRKLRGRPLVPQLGKNRSENDKSTMLPFFSKNETNPAAEARTTQKNTVRERISTTQDTQMDYHIDNDSGTLMDYFQENNSVLNQGKKYKFESELNYEESHSDTINQINNKLTITRRAYRKNGCKKKVKRFAGVKKAKQSRGRPKKLTLKTMKTSSKKTRNPKAEYKSLKVDTENQDESGKIVKEKRGNVSKQECGEVPNVSYMEQNVGGYPDKYPINREIYSLLTDVTTLGCSNESERKFRGRSIVCDQERNAKQMNGIKVRINPEGEQKRSHVSDSETSNDCFQKNNNSIMNQRNKNEFESALHYKENQSEAKNNIDNNQLTTQRADAKSICKRRIHVTEQDFENSIGIKKTKPSRGRPKKLISKNMKTSIKKTKKPKAGHKGTKVDTENHEEGKGFAKNKKDTVLKQKENICKSTRSHTTLQNTDNQSPIQVQKSWNNIEIIPTFSKTSQTNNLQPHEDCFGKKSFNNLPTTPSLNNILPTDSRTCINRQDNELNTKNKGICSTTNLGQSQDEPVSNQSSHQSTLRDKVRLIIMEQLKRSRRSKK